MIFLRTLVCWLLAHTPTTAGVALRRRAYRFMLKSLGPRANIADDVTILGFKNMSVGQSVSVMRQSFLAAQEGSLRLGDRVSINRNVHLDASQGDIQIGNDCLIGPNCVLRAADHVFEDATRPIRTQGHAGGTIILEDDVWLASNVVVIRNVRIGRGSVIGSQSVVTRDIPPFSIAFGVPARVVRSRLADGSSRVR